MSLLVLVSQAFRLTWVVAGSLEKALSLSLEAIGFALQGTVAKAGKDWKSYRTEVVKAVKTSEATVVLLPTDNR